MTEESFIDGGFFKTGDAVRVDEDGYYIILGREYMLVTIELFLGLLGIPFVESALISNFIIH